jgi:TPR repeat protein
MKRIILAAVVGVLVAALSAPAAQAGIDEGWAAYKRGDYTTTLREIRSLAEQGFASAQDILGLLYENGQGVPQDYAEAVEWYRKAAEQGLAIAQFNLGVRYEQGQGVPQDYVEAHIWYNLAAARGNENANHNRDIIAKKMTPQDISVAQKRAREWKPCGKDRPCP